jgi:adenine phosphoribosyltransferase
VDQARATFPPREAHLTPPPRPTPGRMTAEVTGWAHRYPGGRSPRKSMWQAWRPRRQRGPSCRGDADGCPKVAQGRATAGLPGRSGRFAHRRAEVACCRRVARRSAAMVRPSRHLRVNLGTARSTCIRCRSATARSTRRASNARTSDADIVAWVSTEQARRAVLDAFRWVDGHADVWRVFADGRTLASVVAELAAPWRRSGVTRVVGIESRGFLLGAATAVSLGVGFVAIRKGSDGLLPGPKTTVTAEEDYRGHRHELRMQSVLSTDDRALLVDDWAERGSQARAAQALVIGSGAEFLGLSIMVDMLAPEARSGLGRITSLVSADQLGQST